MPDFFNVLPHEDALDLLLSKITPTRKTELLATDESVGRVTSCEIYSSEDLPAFPRSSMDGYSVRAADTFGASESLPAYLDVAGEVAMGKLTEVAVGKGQAAIALTGGMLATGADSVVMLEQTNRISNTTIEVVRPVAPGENVIQVGEDTRVGQRVLPAGHVLRPQDVGALLAVGIVHVNVVVKPVVSIVSTGDELVTPTTTPDIGQIRDVNTYTLSALVKSCGGDSNIIGLVRDKFDDQISAALQGINTGDILVFSAGSSISSRDMTAEILGHIGSPGVLAHGISIKPGKPTIIALVNEKPAFGLPGNPVSAVVVFDLIVRPTIYALTGCTEIPMMPMVIARLSRDVPSIAGREDYVQVSLVPDGDSFLAHPVFGKSNLIYTMVRSTGVIKVPLDTGGLYSGDEVKVRVY